jgi:hypothetical protein
MPAAPAGFSLSNRLRKHPYFHDLTLLTLSETFWLNGYGILRPTCNFPYNESDVAAGSFPTLERDPL